jgi:hypothetical protein
MLLAHTEQHEHYKNMSHMTVDILHQIYIFHSIEYIIIIITSIGLESVVSLIHVGLYKVWHEGAVSLQGISLFA